MVATVDGGPDENLRCRKVIDHAVDHFKTCNLDAFFLITNAPGRSAYNLIERSLTPLSRQLSTLGIPHLNDSAVTIDSDLKVKYFGFSGEALAKVWSSLIVIDGHPVTAEYIDPKCVAQEPDSISVHWYAVHVQESQHFYRYSWWLGNFECTK